MNINYKQSQFELFPGTPGSSTDTGRPRYLFANLNLSVENMVLLGIIILMTMVFIFSLGVEKGKKLVGQSDVSIAVYPPRDSAVAAAPVTTGSIISSDHDRTSSAAASAPIVAVQNTQKTIQPIAVIEPPAIKQNSKSSYSVYEANGRFGVEKEKFNNLSSGQRQNNSTVKATENTTANPFLNKPYTIQVASFKDEEYAQKEASALKKKNFAVFVISKGNFSIVCVGKFSKKEEANGILAKLKKNYNDCLIRRL